MIEIVIADQDGPDPEGTTVAFPPATSLALPIPPVGCIPPLTVQTVPVIEPVRKQPTGE